MAAVSIPPHRYAGVILLCLATGCTSSLDHPKDPEAQNSEERADEISQADSTPPPSLEDGPAKESAPLALGVPENLYDPALLLENALPSPALTTPPIQGEVTASTPPAAVVTPSMAAIAPANSNDLSELPGEFAEESKIEPAVELSVPALPVPASTLNATAALLSASTGYRTDASATSSVPKPVPAQPQEPDLLLTPPAAKPELRENAAELSDVVDSEFAKADYETLSALPEEQEGITNETFSFVQAAPRAPLPAATADATAAMLAYSVESRPELKNASPEMLASATVQPAAAIDLLEQQPILHAWRPRISPPKLLAKPASPSQPSLNELLSEEIEAKQTSVARAVPVLAAPSSTLVGRVEPAPVASGPSLSELAKKEEISAPRRPSHVANAEVIEEENAEENTLKSFPPPAPRKRQRLKSNSLAVLEDTKARADVGVRLIRPSPADETEAPAAIPLRNFHSHSPIAVSPPLPPPPAQPPPVATVEEQVQRVPATPAPEGNNSLVWALLGTLLVVGGIVAAGFLRKKT